MDDDGFVAVHVVDATAENTHLLHDASVAALKTVEGPTPSLQETAEQEQRAAADKYEAQIRQTQQTYAAAIEQAVSGERGELRTLHLAQATCGLDPNTATWRGTAQAQRSASPDSISARRDEEESQLLRTSAASAARTYGDRHNWLLDVVAPTPPQLVGEEHAHLPEDAQVRSILTRPKPSVTSMDQHHERHNALQEVLRQYGGIPE